jgi:demethylmenaquinone methyltransferase/2-methoxy-6-polyprenyl-1,4-benzoquinol methylase
MNRILPVNRSKAQARRFYDRISRVYDTLTASETGLIQRGVELLALQPGEALLEIGPGTGQALHKFAETTPKTGCLVGLDLSHKMLVQAKAKEITPSPLLIQGDSPCLPLPANHFDVVFTAFTLELFSVQDIHQVLGACRRVLKPSGRLGVVAMANAPRTLALRLYEAAHRLFPVAVDCRPIPLPDLLQENGFTLVTAQKDNNWGLPIHLTVST